MNTNNNYDLPGYIESHLLGTRFNFKIPTDSDKNLEA